MVFKASARALELGSEAVYSPASLFFSAELATMRPVIAGPGSSTSNYKPTYDKGTTVGTACVSPVRALT